MRLIIAGGRDYRLTPEDHYVLNKIPDVTCVISGGCSGVDKDGEIWAAIKGVQVVVFPADWKKHGKAAGPIRNKLMAENADAVALFPGGRGTASMFQEAQRAGLKIYDFRKKLF